ncbi:MAG: type II toxin-antitoxin system RelE family toxin [Blautia wexlerae]
MFQITYSKKAEKFLRKQDKTTQYRLFTAISKLPLEGNIKKLQGISGYRLRVGNYRVLFDVNGFVVDIIDVEIADKYIKGV